MNSGQQPEVTISSQLPPAAKTAAVGLVSELIDRLEGRMGSNGESHKTSFFGPCLPFYPTRVVQKAMMPYVFRHGWFNLLPCCADRPEFTIVRQFLF